MIHQSQPVVPPTPSDSMLRDFSQNIDFNLRQLFLAAHVHKIITAAPAANQGIPGDIYLGNLTAGKKLYAKFDDGWYYVNLTHV